VKHRLTILILPAAVCLAVGVHAQMPGRSERPGTGAIGHSADYSEPSTFSVKLPPNPEGTAEDLEMDGKCAQAIPIFRRLAARGAEYAIAQYHLGLCLFDVVKAEPDAHSAASTKQEAAKFIVQAANNGFASAQMSLVAIYLDGNGVGSDPVEAAKWSLIYHENGMRLAIGLPDIAPDLKTRLDSTLTEKAWSEAQSRAETWSPVSRN
jgi:TPR repeat protein